MLRREIKLSNRESIIIIDEFFESKEIEELFSYILDHVQLRFSRLNVKSQEDFPSLSALIGSENIKSCSWLRKLVSEAPPLFFEYFKSNQSKKLKRAQVNVTYWGDTQLIHSDEAVDTTIIYFANPTWIAGWLGELLFYDGDDREVLAAVTPKPGRLVAFQSHLRHRGGVPSRGCKSPRITIALKYTT